MVDLGEAKEIAGQERGFVAGAIASGTLNDQDYSRMQSFASVQEALIDVFIEQEPVDRRAQYQEMLDVAEIAAIAPMRNRILDPQADLATIKASDWFRIASNRISALYELEQEVASHLQEDARDLANTRQTEVWVPGCLHDRCRDRCDVPRLSHYQERNPAVAWPHAGCRADCTGRPRYRNRRHGAS